MELAWLGSNIWRIDRDCGRTGQAARGRFGLAIVLAGSLALAGCSSSGSDLSKIGAATYRGPVANSGNNAKAAGKAPAGDRKAKVGKSSTKSLTKPVAPSEFATGAEAVGNGFYVNNKGHVLTTWLQVQGCRRVAVLDNFELVHVNVIAGGPLNGLAVLDAQKSTPLHAIFRTASPAVGERVTAFAYPILDGLFMPLEAVKGAVRSSSGPQGMEGVLQDTAIVAGQSAGGPLVDERGKAIGIIIDRLSAEWPSGIGYGVQTEMILRLASAAGVEVWTEEEVGGQGDASPGPDAAADAGDYTVPVICFR